MLLNPNAIPSLLWSKLYKREIITDYFPEGKNYEDAYTMPAWFKNIKTAVLSPEITYHYRMRGGSITKIGVAEHHYDFITACNRLADIVHQETPEKFNDKDYYAYRQKIYVAGAKTIARKEADKSLRRMVLERISNEAKTIPSPGWKHTGLKISFRLFLLTRSPKLFERLMRGVNKFDFYAKRRTKHHFE